MITKVVVGAAPVGTGVDVAVAGTGVETGVGGASTVAVGAGGVLAGAWLGAGPMSSPHFAPALGRSVKCPSPAAIIAAAICLGPPSCSRRHCMSSRSSGHIPVFDAARLPLFIFQAGCGYRERRHAPGHGPPRVALYTCGHDRPGVDDFERCPDAAGSFLAERPWTRYDPGEKDSCRGLVFETPEEPGLSLGVLADTPLFSVGLSMAPRLRTIGAEQ